MGKTGKWLRSLLFGKKEKKQKEKGKEMCGNQPSSLPTGTRSAAGSVPAPGERRGRSFRRSAATREDINPRDMLVSASSRGFSDSDVGRKRHAMAVAAATAAAVDAAAAAAQAAEAVVRLTTAATTVSSSSVEEEAAAVRIQAAFRSFLARKALCALKGLVKLQALVRGHLVRMQAATTLRRMQALVTAQAKARARRIRMLEKAQSSSHRQSNPKRSQQLHPRDQQFHELHRNWEENIKIVEMDHGESWSSSRSRNSHTVQTERTEHKPSAYDHMPLPSKVDPLQRVSPSPSALTDMGPRAYGGDFEDFSYPTAQSSPQYLPAFLTPDGTKSTFNISWHDSTHLLSHDYPFYPNYMANTESWRAKARSQSAPKQRPTSSERPPSRRRTSAEGRNIPRGVRMQRSSSDAGSTAYRHPWSAKLDKSGMALEDGEFGSTSANYFRSLIAYGLST